MEKKLINTSFQMMSLMIGYAKYFVRATRGTSHNLEAAQRREQAEVTAKSGSNGQSRVSPGKVVGEVGRR